MNSQVGGKTASPSVCGTFSSRPPPVPAHPQTLKCVRSALRQFTIESENPPVVLCPLFIVPLSACFLAINTCSVDNGGCEHDCVQLTLSQHRCRCWHNYQLKEDGKHCIGEAYLPVISKAEHTVKKAPRDLPGSFQAASFPCRDPIASFPPSPSSCCTTSSPLLLLFPVVLLLPVPASSGSRSRLGLLWETQKEPVQSKGGKRFIPKQGKARQNEAYKVQAGCCEGIRGLLLSVFKAIWGSADFIGASLAKIQQMVAESGRCGGDQAAGRWDTKMFLRPDFWTIPES